MIVSVKYHIPRELLFTVQAEDLSYYIFKWNYLLFHLAKK